MFAELVLGVSERRPRAWGARGANNKATVASSSRVSRVGPAKSAKRAVPAPPKKHAGVRSSAVAAGAHPEPDGWQRRLREQSHNLTRAIEMLEQAVAMMSEPREGTLARAESLRGAGLITMLAAAELLVIAGWFEADQAVKAGTLKG